MLALPHWREGALTNTLSITFDGLGVKDGTVSVAALLAALDGAQDAMQLMVEHLGNRARRPGRPPQWVRDQSGLRLTGTRPGSVIADLDLAPPTSGQASLDDYGPRALAAIQAWDGTEDSTLPKPVVDRLREAASAVPEDVQLWIGNPDDARRVEIQRRGRTAPPGPQAEAALLYGWLREVNWDKRTAQLHDSTGGHIGLRFDGDLDDAMLRLATQYVEVRGAGRFNDHGEWTTVLAEQLTATRSWSEPFDLDTFLADPDPRLFHPDTVVTIDLTDDEWAAFDGAIREGREA